VLFHVMAADDWEAAGGTVTPDPAAEADRDTAEAFLHLCTADQLAGVLERYFAGRDDLVVLTIDDGLLGPALRWEPGIDPRSARSAGNEDPEATELFPHLYGPLGADIIMAASPIGQ